MIAKDMEGYFTKHPDWAALLYSPDGIQWNPSSSVVAYSTGDYHNVERPQILFQDGKPAFLFNAVRTHAGNTFNMTRRIKND
jgi:hypothetical protein